MSPPQRLPCPLTEGSLPLLLCPAWCLSLWLHASQWIGTYLLAFICSRLQSISSQRAGPCLSCSPLHAQCLDQCPKHGASSPVIYLMRELMSTQMYHSLPSWIFVFLGSLERYFSLVSFSGLKSLTEFPIH